MRALTNRSTPSAWMLSVAALLAGFAALAWAASEERQRIAELHRLQREGHQVRALEVRFKESHRGPTYVSYRFVPLERQRFLPVPKLSTQPVSTQKWEEEMKAVERWVADAPKYNPYVWGSQRVSPALRESISLRDDRIVTYLPDAPGINAIGRLTDERIANEWRSNRIFLIAGGWILAFTLGLIQALRLRTKRHE